MRRVTASLVCAWSCFAAVAGSPNFVFIMADDLGMGDLGCYGGSAIATPNIDRLAREGIRFTQCYAGSPVCAPSRCVLLTGLHTGHARIRQNSPDVGGQLEAFGEGGMRLSLTGDEMTIASELRTAGYATGISGKWGLAEPGTAGVPNRVGFDEWLGYLNQNHAAYYYTDYLWENESKRPIPGNDGRTGCVYSNDLFRDFALDFIRRHRAGPFFLYVPVTIPHHRMEVPDLGVYRDAPWPEAIRIYAAMISRLDGYVGEILDEIDRLDLAEDTVIFFTSDNGPVRGERSRLLGSAAGLRGAKGTLYEGGIRAPMIIRWPGVVSPGRVDDTTWGFVDVLPTLLELAAATVPEGIDGVSVAPILREPGVKLPDRYLYWEFPRDRLWQAARHDRWKAIRFGTDQPIELYDLRVDPGESSNVSHSHPGQVTAFEQFFATARFPSPHWPVD